MEFILSKSSPISSEFDNNYFFYLKWGPIGSQPMTLYRIGKTYRDILAPSSYFRVIHQRHEFNQEQVV